MRYILLTILFFIQLSTIAQEDPVLVDATGDREIEPAYRIALTPKIIDTSISAALVNYPLLPIKIETQTEVEPINPATIKTVEKLPKLYSTYIKLGVGTELMPLGEVYFNSTRSRKYIYGAHLKHLSSFGNISGYAPAT